jgi:putative two-component system response regulator
MTRVERIPHLLVVDDDVDLRRLMVRFLSRRGFELVEAGSGAEALVALAQTRPDLVLLDLNLPGMNGLDFIPEALELDPSVGIVMLTGESDAATATRCLRAGALDFVAKPFELADLDAIVRRSLAQRATAVEDRAVFNWLKQEVARRTGELEQARQRQEELTVSALDALVLALEAKSAYFLGHSTRVANLAAAIANRLDLVDSEVETVRLAARLRDLGMLGIRDEVLNRQGGLSSVEVAHVREHPVIGARILGPLAHLGPIPAIVRSHHERWDGGGYPDGLGGTEIPLAARIIHVADVFDAMTTTRPYQPTMRREDALVAIVRMAGTAFDPAVVEALVLAVHDGQALEFVPDDLAPSVALSPLTESEAA